jgi:hypothetical protein
MSARICEVAVIIGGVDSRRAGLFGAESTMRCRLPAENVKRSPPGFHTAREHGRPARPRGRQKRVYSRSRRVPSLIWNGVTNTTRGRDPPLNLLVSVKPRRCGSSCRRGAPSAGHRRQNPPSCAHRTGRPRCDTIRQVSRWDCGPLHPIVVGRDAVGGAKGAGEGAVIVESPAGRDPVDGEGPLSGIAEVAPCVLESLSADPR